MNVFIMVSEYTVPTLRPINVIFASKRNWNSKFSFFLDFEEKLKLATMFYNVKESEAAKDMKLVQYHIVSSDEHERVYTRIFFDEIQSLVADETLQFQNTHFSISPIVSVSLCSQFDKRFCLLYLLYTDVSLCMYISRKETYGLIKRQR